MPARLVIVVLVLAAGWAAGTAGGVVRHAVAEKDVASALPSSRLTAAAAAGSWQALPLAPAPFPFHLVGVHWQGRGAVELRWLQAGGGWAPWVEVEEDRGADAREAGLGPAWRLGEPTWTGRAVRLEARVQGRVDRLAVHYVSSPPGSPRPRARRAAVAEAPSVISRAGWGADESIVRAPPYYAERLERAIVHHTAGALPVTPTESAQIVRAIQAYHVQANGWNDIGYNFLVDPFGQVFEGRGGGLDRPVVGAHVRGFNTGAVGVAVLGNYETDVLTQEARLALVNLLAWRLDVAHVDPASLVTAVSAGNQVYPAGVPVTLRAIAGHRDMDLTACPGVNVYGLLDGIAPEVAVTGGPKLFEPRATPASVVVRTDGTVEPVRITARLSDVLPWAVTIADGEGRVLASGQGLGPSVDWTWDGLAAGGAGLSVGTSVTATITSVPLVRPAQIALAASPPAAVVASLRMVPATITPDGDGEGDSGRITFALASPAAVTVTLSRSDGATVATLLAGAPLAGGPAELAWDGTIAPGLQAEDGRYRLTVVADTGSALASATTDVVVDRTLGPVAVPRYLSPNGDGRHDLLPVRLALNRPAAVTLTVRRGASRLARLEAGTLEAGAHVVTWAPRAGTLPRDGGLTVVVRTVNDLGSRARTATTSLDRTAPRLSIRQAWASLRAFKVVASLTEPARLQVSADRGAVMRLARAAGRAVIWRRETASRLRIRAWDSAGNAIDPIVLTLRPRRR